MISADSRIKVLVWCSMLREITVMKAEVCVTSTCGMKPVHQIERDHRPCQGCEYKMAVPRSQEQVPRDGQCPRSREPLEAA